MTGSGSLNMTRNHLGEESSPYLLQHKDNPVHWWPWGEEALAEACKSGKPILLSVGYAACHWCHVMAHESFEDDEVASVMNELFVNIKVDREERPDVDTIYMNALHALGEQGGWPLTMFLTPEAEPFWGGTYFPKEPRYGRPGFISLLHEVSRVFLQEPGRVADNAKSIIAHITPKRGEQAQGELTESLISDAAKKIAGLVDPVHGGLRGAPKFPQSPLFAFLWRAAIRYGDSDMLSGAINTLTHICQGGIYDHLAGGFARYAVDGAWLVPHFEKMLYDNAQLIALLTHAWQETQDPLFERRTEETIQWLLSEMTLEEGGFASSLDADSESEEGKFYVWSADEIRHVLGKQDAEYFGLVYDVSEAGNWEGKTILNRLQSLECLEEKDEERLSALRGKLLSERNSRIRPGFDDKVLADWNGLMITALAKAGVVFEKHEWIAASIRAYDFIRTRMNHGERLYHSWREGIAKTPGTASDYANMIRAALELHAVTGEEARITDACGWAEVLARFYWSDELAGYTLAASDTSDIILQPFTGHDDATPNHNGVMVSNLMALWMITGGEAYRTRAETILNGFTGDMASNLYAHTSLLAGAMDVIAPAHIVIIAPGGRGSAAALLAGLNSVSFPGAVVQVIKNTDGLADTSPASGKTSLEGKATAYVCAGPHCTLPETDAAVFTQILKTQRALAPSAKG